MILVHPRIVPRFRLIPDTIILRPGNTQAQRIHVVSTRSDDTLPTQISPRNCPAALEIQKVERDSSSSAVIAAYLVSANASFGPSADVELVVAESERDYPLRLRVLGR